MPVRVYYRAVCQNCDLECFRYGETRHGAVAEAQGIGWSAYPLLCEGCTEALKERVRRESENRRAVRDPGEGSERA